MQHNLRLEELRNKLGLNHTEMSKMMGVSLSTYNNWRFGQNKMSKSAIRCMELLECIKDMSILSN